MPSRCCEFVDSRLRRSPPAHKLHSTTATTSYELDSGKGEPISRLPAFAYSPRKLSKRPAPSQTSARVLQGCGFRYAHMLGTNADPNQPGRNATQNRKNLEELEE